MPDPASSTSRATVPLVAVLVLGMVVAGGLGWASYERLADYHDALTLWQEALAHQPDDPAVHNALGMVLKARGATAEALAHFQQALQLRPGFRQAAINLGLLLLDDRPQDAIDYFERAVRAQPDDRELLNALGAALCNANRPDEALPYLEQAARLPGGLAGAHHNLANALFKTGQTKRAFAEYEQSLRLNPNSAQGHNDLGLALAKTGKPLEAIPHFERAVHLSPHDAEMQLNLGAALVDSDRASEAVEHLLQATTLRPTYAAAWANLAAAHAQLQHPKEATSAAEQALRLARSQGQAGLTRQIEGLLHALQTEPSAGSNVPSTSLPPAGP